MMDREPEPNDVSANSEADAPALERGWGANLSERRRREAVELVRDRVTELESMLERAAPGSGVLTGSATCAEVRLADADRAHRYLRIALIATPDVLPILRAALEDAGFLASPDGSDLSIIRIAHANGRRPHYVVYDGTRDRLDAPDAPHPTSEAGRRLRARRLAAATRTPAFVMSRRREIRTDRGTEAETLEVQVTDDVASA
ncbi:MAG: hypothetical protein CMJ27_12910 [Phycisphaerae bacterium]|nr:hypothetical protein [Phycisphaerae bacterium]